MLPYSNVLLIWLTRFTEEEDPENEMLISCLYEEHCFETLGAKSEEQNGKKQWGAMAG
jgi:hypothetical protein